MTTFVAIHRGHTVLDSVLIGVSGDEELVQYVAKVMDKQSYPESDDAVLDAVYQGRLQALRLIANAENDTCRNDSE